MTAVTFFCAKKCKIGAFTFVDLTGITLGAEWKINAEGNPKENRKIALTLEEQTDIGEVDKEVIWQVLQNGEEAEDCYAIDTDHSDAFHKEMIFRKAGTYQILATVIAGGTKTEVSKELVIEKDLEPVASLQTDAAYYTRDEEGTAVIGMKDLSYSPDGDTIGQRIWTVYYDADNNGKFTEEEGTVLDDGNETDPVFETKQVGRYKVVLTVVETFSDTIPKLLAEDAYLRADTTVLDEKECTFEVGNQAPEASLNLYQNRKLDVLLLHNGLNEKEETDYEEWKEKIKTEAERRNIDISIQTALTEKYEYIRNPEWTLFDHKDYDGVNHHITVEDERTCFTGYKYDAMKDFTFADTKIDGNKRIGFTLRMEEDAYSEIEGSGMLFDASIEDISSSDSYNHHRYEILDEHKEWNEAKALCEERGGYLATITSDRELSYIKNHILPANRSFLYWLGGFRQNTQSDIWEWITGEDFYWTNWDSGEPNNHRETVLEMYGKDSRYGQWNDTLCPVGKSGSYGTSSIQILCEYDGPHMSGNVLLLTNEGMKLIAIEDVDTDNLRNGSYANLEKTGELIGVYPYDTSVEEHQVVITEKDGKVTIEDNGVIIAENIELKSTIKGSGIGAITSYMRTNEERKMETTSQVSDVWEDGIQNKWVVNQIEEHEWQPGATHIVCQYSNGDSMEYRTELGIAKVIRALLEKECLFAGIGNGNDTAFDVIHSAVGDWSGSCTNLEELFGTFVGYMDEMTQQVASHITTSDSISYDSVYQDPESDPMYAQHWEYEYDPSVFDSTEHGERIVFESEQPITQFEQCGAYTIRLKVQDDPTAGEETLSEYRRWSEEKELGTLLVVHNRPTATIKADVYKNDNEEIYSVNLITEAEDKDHLSESKKGIIREYFRYKELQDTTWTEGVLPNTIPVGKIYFVEYVVVDKEQNESAPAVEIVDSSVAKKMDVLGDEKDPVITLKVSSHKLIKNETAQIHAYAQDDYGIKSFQLFWDDIELMNHSGSIGYACMEIGKHLVKAVAEDFNGNKAEKTVTVEVEEGLTEGEYEVKGEISDIHLDDENNEIQIFGSVNAEALEGWKLTFQKEETDSYTELATGNKAVKDSLLGTIPLSSLEDGTYEVILWARDTYGTSCTCTSGFTYKKGEQVIKTESGEQTEDPINPDPFTKNLAVALSYTSAPVGTEVKVQVTLPENVKEDTLQIRMGDTILAEGTRKTSFVSEKVGKVTIQAFGVTDEGEEVTAEADCTFFNDKDKNPPTAAITAPTIDTVLTEPVDFIGSAYDNEELDFWKLEYCMDGEKDYILLNEGTEPVKDDVLGHFDTTMLMNGQYHVKLTVKDQGGNIRRLENDYVVEGNLKVGAMNIGFTDITAPMGGTTVSVNRMYDSRNKAKGDFGIGWTLGMQGMELIESNKLDEGYEMIQSGSVFSTRYQMAETESHDVVVTYGDGTSDRFVLTFTPERQGLIPISETKLGYRCVTNQKVKLEILGDTSAMVYSNGLVFEDERMYDDLKYKLTTADGVEIYLTGKNGVYQIVDTNDNVIKVDKNGYHASNGKSITFTRDGEGRITKAEDPAGNIMTYGYDKAGDLVTVTDFADRTVSFTYDKKHNLMEIIDPSGVAVARNEYDEDGRLVATIDADGNRTEYEHDIDGRRELVKDRLGNQTLYVYDDAGNVLSTTDANGNTTKSTYDAYGNVLTKTDAKGNTTSYAYDANGNLTQVTDVDGNSIKNTYNADNLITSMSGVEDTKVLIDYDRNGHLSATTDSEGNKTTYDKDKNGNVTGMADDIGTVMTAKYDGNGNVTETEDSAGNKVLYTYDENGNKLSQTTYAVTEAGTVEQTTRFVYNDAGELIQTIDADGNSTSVERNAKGQMSASVDSKGRRTEYQYDKYGNVSEILYSDGTKETFEYDAEGRNTKSTSRMGLITSYTYDKVGNLLKQTDARGNTTSYTYDKNYNLLSVTTPTGAVTTYTYDALNRNTAIEDAEGNVTQFAYNDLSLQTSMTDAKGNVTTYEYDKNGQRTKVIYADGSYVETKYDERGRTVWQKDTAGRKTEYAYDSSDRLTQVKQNNGSVTTYAYDQTGNLTGITDANGNTTTYVYDKDSRRIKTILADGEESTTRYDRYGMVTSYTDYNGVTTDYSYDDEDRLVKETTKDEVKEYTYDTLGRLTDITTGGSHITYGYNEYGELAEKSYENGQRIAYTYDKYGRNSGITVSRDDKVLTSTKYEYDKMNRLTRVVAHDGTATVYTYDANGNRETATFANGEVLTFTYDDLNRLILQKEVDRNGTVIAQYQYTLGKGGEREKVTETGACGNVETTYDFDKAGRLVKEVTEHQLNSEKKIYIYAYDAVGNRIEKVEDGAKTTYVYNSRNQLVSEESTSGKINYAYDANGNLLNKSGAGVSVTYTYDVYNRLVQYADQSNTETYTYDAEGVRRSKKNATEDIVFISDTTGSLSMLIAETDGEGNLIASYNRADTLISQTRGGTTFTYLYDGHGDVRALLNEAGRITDQYSYTAYGELTDRSGDTENHFLYTGEYYDGVSDLYYLRARYMSTATGTFISMDTYEGSIYDPDSLHKYLYANGNPVKYSDPSGNMFGAIGTLIATTYAVVYNNFDTLHLMGMISGTTNAVITSFLGGSDDEIAKEFVKGYITGFGLGAVMYVVAAYEIMTIAEMSLLMASSNTTMSIVLTIGATLSGNKKEAIVYGTLSILSMFTVCKLYNLNCSTDIIGEKGSATIKYDNSNPQNIVTENSVTSTETPAKTELPDKLINGNKLKVSEILDLASEFLGEGYTEPNEGSGRFVSQDGTRVFRMGENDILGRHAGGPHVNFEMLAPNPDKPGKMKVILDIHI